MKAYPFVLSEEATLEAVVAGRSLARYGDGEFNLCLGRGIPCQSFDRELSDQLRGLLRHSGHCLIGIPNLRPDSPKIKYWLNYSSVARLFSDRSYGSAFISRPDSAPWIDTLAYWDLVESLWLGQHVTLVRGNKRSLVAADLTGAASVHEIIAPAEHAWSYRKAILKKLSDDGAARVLLCLGPTATVLAADLCARGIHAVDVGHLGLFLRKHRRGEPLERTEADKVLA